MWCADMQVKTKFWGRSMEVQPIGSVSLQLIKWELATATLLYNLVPLWQVCHTLWSSVGHFSLPNKSKLAYLKVTRLWLLVLDILAFCWRLASRFAVKIVAWQFGSFLCLALGSEKSWGDSPCCTYATVLLIIFIRYRMGYEFSWLGWLMCCHSQWSITLTSLVCIKLCLMLLPMSSYSCVWNLLHSPESRSLFQLFFVAFFFVVLWCHVSSDYFLLFLV